VVQLIMERKLRASPGAAQTRPSGLAVPIDMTCLRKPVTVASCGSVPSMAVRPETSSKMIQKELAFRRERSGTGTVPGANSP
jgi:hypothetical protein